MRFSTLCLVILIGGLDTVHAQWSPVQILPPLVGAYIAVENAGYGSHLVLQDDLLLVATETNCGTPQCTFYGKIIIYGFDGNAWVEQQIVSALDDTTDGFSFGSTFVLRDNLLIVGAPAHSANGTTSGSVYIFEQVGQEWVETERLTPSDATSHSYFGGHLDYADGTLIVGAGNDDEAATNAGAAYVFQFLNNEWHETQKLIADDADSQDHFGEGIGISGNFAIISSGWDDDNGSNSGSSYVFGRVGNLWIQSQKLLASQGAADDRFGNDLVIQDSIALIGSVGHNGNGGSGAVYVFRLNDTAWVEQQIITVSDGNSGDKFGTSIALHEEFLLIGASQDDDNGWDSGSAYLFEYSNQTFQQSQKLSPVDGEVSDFFGVNVAISASWMSITAARDDIAADQSGSVYVYSRDVISEITESEYHQTIQLYPNPTAEFIVIGNKDFRNANFKIFNALGELILEGESNNEINIFHLNSGVYTIVLRSMTGVVGTGRFHLIK